MNNDKEHQFELLVRQHKRTIYTVCYMFSRNKAESDLLQARYEYLYRCKIIEYYRNVK